MLKALGHRQAFAANKQEIVLLGDEFAMFLRSIGIARAYKRTNDQQWLIY